MRHVSPRAWRYITSPGSSLGVHEASFRVEKVSRYAHSALGAIPASEAFTGASVYSVGYVFVSGGFWNDRRRWIAIRDDKSVEYKDGDVVTVRLDLDESTIAIRKNGADVAPPYKIARADAYHFALTTWEKCDGVTIVEDTTANYHL